MLYILQVFPNITSGYYKIQTPNGSSIPVYCDMESYNCDDKSGKRGWMIVAHLNMSEPGVTCPLCLTQ